MIIDTYQLFVYKKTTGTVTEYIQGPLVTTTPKVIYTVAPIVTYTVGQQTYTHTSDHYRYPPQYTIGETINIYYPESTPEKGNIITTKSFTENIIILTVFLVFIIISLRTRSSTVSPWSTLLSKISQQGIQTFHSQTLPAKIISYTPAGDEFKKQMESLGVHIKNEEQWYLIYVEVKNPQTKQTLQSKVYYKDTTPPTDIPTFQKNGCVVDIDITKPEVCAEMRA